MASIAAADDSSVVTTGPSYFANESDFHPAVGANGADGTLTGGDKNGKCSTDGSAAPAGPDVSGTVTYAPVGGGTFAGTIVVAGSTAGAGGTGGPTNKDCSNARNGGAGGTAGNVSVTVTAVPAPSGGYL